MKLVKDPVYQNGPVNLYSAFYSGGYEDYKAKSWQAGYEKLKKLSNYQIFSLHRKCSIRRLILMC